MLCRLPRIALSADTWVAFLEFYCHNHKKLLGLPLINVLARLMSRVERSSVTGKKCSTEDDPPNINWAQHVTALENFSSRYNFLYSNFLFSLPTQKPCSESSGKEIWSTRPISCNIQKTGRLQTLQIEKAWKTLFSSQHKRGYPRPGITAPMKTLKNNATTTDGLGSSNTLTETESFQRSGLSGHRNLPTYQRGQNLSNKSEAGNCGSSQIGIANRKAMGGFKILQENLKGISIISGYSSPKNCDPWHTDDYRYAGRNHADAMDDEILENIDVDQIVMNHYQVMGTHQSSVLKSMPFCPNSIESTVTSSQWNSLPQEFCEQCKHGFELQFCPEALNHLQDKKDRLITISNELLDNSDLLSPKKFENLCQERLLLNKQIHQLQIHLEDGVRQSSHAMATISPVHSFHLDTPLSRIPAGSLRSVSDVHVQNKFGVSGDWNSPPSFSTTDGLKFSNAPIEREVLPPKVLEVTCIEGSSDKRWKSFDFLWTKKLEAYNRKIFGNHSFRPNQREVINATMSGYDVFVLMPTGGGKSLTYQLPSLLCRGLTLVVSPLVSLIQDQIMHLLQANIPAAYFTASMEWAEQQEILRELQSDTSKYKLLFVTPEKIAKSEALLRILDALYSRESLSRIVIDEAHCVSEWGHDFRPDYQGLGILKQKYPNTPVLALTATATASVKEDVVRALGLSNCIIFKQTFNRSNLWYSIVPKTSKCLNDIDKFIKDNHFDECGIIYCLSRMDCEKVAEKLQECGHKASFYHGSMDSQQRTHTQKQWSKDELNIICATVAFGMGINKPDVRFVIHHSLPKSIEGYHQECGRAGRDGLRSSCVLYYNYGDYIRVKHMLMQGVLEHSLFATGSRSNLLFSNDRVLETNLENLLRMVNYCENDSDCRRVLQLFHFGEKFNPLDCQKTCDNCCKILNFVERDVTDIARQLLDLIKETGCQFTMSHILEVYKGSMKTNIKKHKHYHLSLHGAGKHLPRGEASRVMRHLVIMDILTEEVKKSDIYGSISSVLKVNDSKARSIYSGEQTITLRFPSCAKAYMNKSTIPLAKASSFMKTNFEQHTPVRAQIEADLNLSAKLYAALRRLRTILVKEADEGVMAYHIFGNATLQQLSKKIPKTKEELLEVNGIGKAKMLKYGDRVLETIESVIREQLKGNKNSSSSENDTSKRKRGSICLEPVANDDDFDQSDVQLRKGAMNVGSSRKCLSENLSISSYNDRLIDLELDGYGTQNEE